MRRYFLTSLNSLPIELPPRLGVNVYNRYHLVTVKRTRSKHPCNPCHSYLLGVVSLVTNLVKVGKTQGIQAFYFYQGKGLFY